MSVFNDGFTFDSLYSLHLIHTGCNDRPGRIVCQISSVQTFGYIHVCCQDNVWQHQRISYTHCRGYVICLLYT